MDAATDATTDTASEIPKLKASVGQGRHRVWFERHGGLDGDLVYVVGGGDRPHIGSVVLKVPGEEIRILKIGTHKDHLILVPIAEEASRKYGRTVVVAGGVHIDNATKEDIDQVMENCRAFLKGL